MSDSTHYSLQGRVPADARVNTDGDGVDIAADFILEGRDRGFRGFQ